MVRSQWSVLSGRTVRSQWSVLSGSAVRSTSVWPVQLPHTPFFFLFSLLGVIWPFILWGYLAMYSLGLFGHVFFGVIWPCILWGYLAMHSGVIWPCILGSFFGHAFWGYLAMRCGCSVIPAGTEDRRGPVGGRWMMQIEGCCCYAIEAPSADVQPATRSR